MSVLSWIRPLNAAEKWLGYRCGRLTSPRG
jgi:hypothetical protein